MNQKWKNQRKFSFVVLAFSPAVKNESCWEGVFWFVSQNTMATQCINHLHRHSMLYFSLELFTICSYPFRLAFKSTKANLAFSLMYLFYPLATFANHFFISFSLIFPKTNCCLEYFLLSFQITIWTLFFYIY